MKRIFLSYFTILIYLISNSVQAQNPVPFSMQNVPLDKVEWAPGEVIIKLDDSININILKQANSTGIAVIDTLLNIHDIASISSMFPTAQTSISREMETYNGYRFSTPKLENILLIELKDTSESALFNMISAFEDLQSLISFVEPNYLFNVESSDFMTNDSLLNAQWAFSATRADSARVYMENNGISDSSIVIAIIDSGTDSLHLDLRNKVAYNALEKYGQPGVDDDQNGYIDDVWGWDFVNNDNEPFDDLGHGTHCASIAIATNNNITGMAGISKDARFMSYKVLQSNNSGTSSNIASAVFLAAQNGADIISMSLGGYGRSIALENALQYAYGYSTLVASAGNDGICIRADGQVCPDGSFPLPSYPAAYSFVMGVQATKDWNYGGYRVGWSNYDLTGPYWSDFPDKFNYEVNAPGYQIMGALASGNSGLFDRFVKWNGTSMAAPVVAGLVSIYKAIEGTTISNEDIFVKFINSWYNPELSYEKDGGYPYPHVDIIAALFNSAPTTPLMTNFELVDTILGNNDGVADGGEIISIYADIKNLGGYSDSVWAVLSVGSFEDSTVIDVLNDTVFLGAMSEFSTINNAFNPWTFQVDSQIANYRNIQLRLNFYSTGNPNPLGQEFGITVRNGRKFNSGIYPGVTTLYPTDLNLIEGNVIFDTLVIKPGTIVRINDQKSFSFNHIVAIGTADSIITFQKYENSSGKWGFIRSSLNNYIPLFKFCRFEDARPYGAYAALVKSDYGFQLEDCIIENCEDGDYGLFWQLNQNSTIKRCIFKNNSPSRCVISEVRGVLEDNLIVDNLTGGCPNYGGANFGAIELSYQSGPPGSLLTYPNIRRNSIFGNRQLCNYYGTEYYYQITAYEGGGFTSSILAPNYFGFTNPNDIEAAVLDYGEYPFMHFVEASDSAMQSPSPFAHGHIWKVLIDGMNTNHHDTLVPFIAGGNHIMQIHFNRPMNTGVEPIVRYGSVFPYSALSLKDSAQWSSDSTVYIVYFSIDPLSVSNGTKGISITDYEDNEFFEGPRETDRFKFNISVYGALSNNFQAQGDTGLIRLNWETPTGGLSIIGYNVYRYDTLNLINGHPDTLLLNQAPILDTNYIDYTVQGGVMYNYFFRAIKTSLELTDNSSIASAMSLSSAPKIIELRTTSISPTQVAGDFKINPKDLNTTYYLRLIDETGSATNTISYNVGVVDLQFHTKTFSFSGLTSNKSYSIVVIAQNAMGVSVSDTLHFQTLHQPSISINGNTTTCTGVPILFQAMSSTSDSTITYTWSINNTTAGNGSSFNFNPASPGTYTIKVTITGNTIVQNDSEVQVQVLQSQPISLSAVNGTAGCTGDQFTITATPGLSNYSWNNGANSASITVTQGGDYFLSAYDPITGCTRHSDTVHIQVNAAPIVNLNIDGGNTFCLGTSTYLRATPGYSVYEWTKDGGVITGATDSILEITDGGIYQVRVTNSNSCQALSNTIVANLSNPISAFIVPQSSTTFCQGGSVTLNGPIGNYSYLWSNGATTPSVVISSPMNISLIVIDSSGCSQTSPIESIVVNNVPSLSTTLVGNDTLCAGEFANITASGGFSSYQWNTGAVTQNLTINTSGDYYVTGITADGCVVQSDTVPIFVHPPSIPTITPSGPTTICPGDSIMLSASSGDSYLWSTGETTQNIYVSSSGYYTVDITNSNGCNTTSNPIYITGSTVTTATISYSGSTVLCQGESMTLSAPIGYANYNWSNGSNSSYIQVSQSGSYWLTMSTAAGCQVNSDTINIQTQSGPSISITINGADLLCEGDSVELSATPGLSNYLWNTGETTESIWAYPNNTYSVEATSISSGCSSQSLITTIDLAPTPSKPVIYYSSNNNWLISSAPNGNQWYFNNVAIAGADSTIITPTDQGVYLVEVTNSEGCMNRSDGFNYVNIGVDEAQRFGVKLYPMPNDGKFILELENGQFNPIKCSISNLLGDIIYETDVIDNQHIIDISTHPVGTYFISIIGNTEIVNLKMIKSK